MTIRMLNPDTRTPQRWLAVLPILVHIVLAVLGATDRDTYRLATWSGSTAQMVALIVDHPAWTAVNLTCAVFLALAIHPPQVIWAYSLSSSVMAVWGLAVLATGLWADHPVSLLGPMILLMVAGYAHHVATMWAASHALDKTRGSA